MPPQGGKATHLVIVPNLCVLTYIFIENIYSLTHSQLQSKTPDVTLPTSKWTRPQTLQVKCQKQAHFCLAQHKETLCALVNTVMTLWVSLNGQNFSSSWGSISSSSKNLSHWSLIAFDNTGLRIWFDSIWQYRTQNLVCSLSHTH